MKWEDHFGCVSRAKIIRQILRLRDEYDKIEKDEEHVAYRDGIYMVITELESLIS